jgi:hypothetical protein
MGPLALIYLLLGWTKWAAGTIAAASATAEEFIMVEPQVSSEGKNEDNLFMGVTCFVHFTRTKILWTPLQDPK